MNTKNLHYLTILLPLFAILIIFGFFLSHTHHLGGVNLWPRFDAPQYVLTAANWLRYGEPAILIGNLFYPARYLFGYSFLLIPQLLISDFNIPQIYYTTIVLSGLTLIVYYFFLYDITRSITISTLATLFLATLPFYQRYSVLVMSDVPSLGLLIGMTWLYYRIMKRQDNTEHFAHQNGDYLYWLALGFLSGYAGSWRLSYALPLIVFISHYYLFSPHKMSTRINTILCAICSAGIPVGLMFTFNAVYYGKPFYTGYHVWDFAYRPEGEYAFNLKFILGRVHDDRIFGNLPNYILRMLGAGLESIIFGFRFNWEMMYGFPFAFAAIYGIVRFIKNPLNQGLNKQLYYCWFIGSGFIFLFFLCYVYQQDRFINFMLPILCLFAAIGLSPIEKGKMKSEQNRNITNCLFLFFALLIVLMHLLMVRGARADLRMIPRPLYYEIQSIKDEIPKDAVVFTNANISLMNMALEGDNLVLPFLQDHLDRNILRREMLQRYPYETARSLVMEMTDYHILVIDQLETKPIKKWKEDIQIDYLQFLFTKGARFNQYLADNILVTGRRIFIILLVPNDYLNNENFADLSRHLIKLAGSESGAIGLFELK